MDADYWEELESLRATVLDKVESIRFAAPEMIPVHLADLEAAARNAGSGPEEVDAQPEP